MAFPGSPLEPSLGLQTPSGPDPLVMRLHQHLQSHPINPLPTPTFSWLLGRPPLDLAVSLPRVPQPSPRLPDPPRARRGGSFAARRLCLRRCRASPGAGCSCSPTCSKFLHIINWPRLQLGSAEMRQRGNNKQGGGSRGRNPGGFALGCGGAGGDPGGPRCSFLSQLGEFWQSRFFSQPLHHQPGPAQVRAGRPLPRQPGPPEVELGVRQPQPHAGGSQSSAGLVAGCQPRP